MFHKLDDWLFSATSYFVKKWVKRKKHKQHKYDLGIIMRKIELVIWVIVFTIPLTINIIRHDIGGIIIFTVLAIVIAYLQIRTIISMQEIKEDYDWIYEKRKNPVVYHGWKEMLEAKYNEEYDQRKWMIAMWAVWMIWIAWATPYMLLLIPFMIFNMYLHFIFDFEDPDQKEKNKEALTEVMQRAFQNLLGNLNPSPI